MTVDVEPEATFERRARRIDAAERAVAKLDADARAAVAELVAAHDDLQAAVLRSLVVRFRADARGRELLFDAIDDPEVYAALVKAGVVRPTLAMRAVQVLEGIRPYITSHGGDVELVRIEDGVAYVRLVGACQSCSSSSDTLSDLVAEALLEHLPELEAVAEADAPIAPVETFIPLTALGRRPGGAGS